MRAVLFAPMFTILVTACGAQDPGQVIAKVEVSNVVVRLAGVEGRPAAAYFTLHGGEAPDRLVSISSPRVATIELHESSTENGIMTMRALTGVDLPSRGAVAFQPGGNHAMLFGIDPVVKPGTDLPLRFSFQGGSKVDVKAKTIGMADDMPMSDDETGHDH